MCCNDVEESVSESDTEKTVSTLELPRAEDDKEPIRILFTDNEKMKQAIELIFGYSGPVPNGTFDRIIESYRQGKGNFQAYIDQQCIFDKQLPLENEYIKVKYECGYLVEFKYTNEYMKIPIYYFWRGFEKCYSWMWEKESEKESVSESDTEQQERMNIEKIY